MQEKELEKIGEILKDIVSAQKEILNIAKKQEEDKNAAKEIKSAQEKIEEIEDSISLGPKWLNYTRKVKKSKKTK